MPDTNAFTTSRDVFVSKEEDYAAIEYVDPASTPIGEAPAMAGVNESGTITDYKLWLPCAVKCMENF